MSIFIAKNYTLAFMVFQTIIIALTHNCKKS